ncbi:MAG TPA: tetratricopeptide repeat protein, partial [Lacipirellulaceae bacterium]|nr:tetratricopeptide repeat protein [Lacipirellulaceae bacterium]
MSTHGLRTRQAGYWHTAAAGIGAALLGCLAGYPAAYAQSGASEPALPSEAESGDELRARERPAPADAAGFVARGRESLAAGAADAALADFNEALRRDPANLEALKARADLHLASRRWTEAVADYSALVAREPDAAHRYRDRGWAYHAAGDYQAAINDFDEMLHIDGADSDAYNARGAVYEALAGTRNSPERERLFNQALRDYNAAIIRRPRDATLLANRAALQIKLRN